MIKRLSIVLISCMILSSSIGASTSGTRKNSNPDKQKTKAVSILMFIPGIQQLKSGGYIKGSLLLGSFIGCITGSIIHNTKGNNWYEKYTKATDVDAVVQYRKKTENSFKKRNLFMVGALAVWLAHILDLKFFKSKNGGVKGEAGKNGFNINFYYSF